MTSERAFQLQIQTVRNAIRLSPDLGLGRKVYHDGFVVDQLMPDATEWGAETPMHECDARLVVTVNLECGEEVITEAAISASIVNIVNDAVPAGRVWDQLKIATSDAERKAFYVSNGKVYNCWMIHLIGLNPILAGGIDNDPVSDVYTYELRYIRGHDK